MNKQINRHLNWVSSLDTENHDTLNLLKSQMIQFYQNDSYFSDTNYYALNKNNWIVNPIYKDILNESQKFSNILEIGCGAASILETGNIKHSIYTGVDFSENLIFTNRNKYPDSQFEVLDGSNILPFADNTFDMVFSAFVIEHVVYPASFLVENIRVLKPGGSLCILCPDFLGKGRMNSQRVGFSQGTGREKLRQGKIIDFLLTAFDNKMRVPFLSMLYRLQANSSPKFFVNYQPTCFVDSFSADVDAVYLTYKPEIINYTNSIIDWINIKTDSSAEIYAQKYSLIYLKGQKLMPSQST